MANLCTGHVAAGAQSDLIWVHRLVIAEVPPTVQIGGYRVSSVAQRKLQRVMRGRWLLPPDRFGLAGNRTGWVGVGAQIILLCVESGMR